MYGFRYGPRGVFTGKYVKIDDQFMDQYRNMGGFDMIGSGRDKIKGDDQFQASAKVCNDLNLDGLIVIGGDDSNTNAALLAEYFQSINHRTHVIGCPKTIDGDLKNDYIPVSFGFDTACKIYSELIGNICVDALSAQKYYHFVRLMGRSASHITMECAFETHPNYTFIGEEIKEKKKSVKQITQEVVELIVERSKIGKNYGVILLPEGLIEFIPEMGALIEELNEVIATGCSQEEIADHLKEQSRELFNYLPQSLRDQLTLDRDSHGNVKVSQIETEKFIVSCIEKELDELKKQGKYTGSFNSLCHFFGYEGRCGLPSCFDTNYCYALGYNAGVLIHEGLNGMMSTISNLDAPVEEWTAGGVPVTMMMNIERRNGKDEPVIKKALVELDGLPYQKFLEFSAEWRLGDCYSFPGPIQFTGPAANIINQTLAYDIQARKARLGK